MNFDGTTDSLALCCSSRIIGTLINFFLRRMKLQWKMGGRGILSPPAPRLAYPWQYYLIRSAISISRSKRTRLFLLDLDPSAHFSPHHPPNYLRCTKRQPAPVFFAVTFNLTLTWNSSLPCMFRSECVPISRRSMENGTSFSGREKSSR